jgi:hypothetical protein
MAARLILHIGTEKTGSTAIQRFLSSQRDCLFFQGYGVPRSLGAVEHRRFALFFYQHEQKDDLTQTEGLDQLCLQDRKAAIAIWQQEFDEEIARRPDHSWVVSSEHIHSRILHNESCLEKMAAYVKERFDEVQIIVYLREPLSAALSLWSTAVLNGAALTDLPLPDNEYWHRLCCHRSTIDQLEKWFPGQFRPRLFAPENWIDGDIIRDFSVATGINLPFDYQTSPQRANTSLSWLSLSLIARLNREGRPSRELVKAIRDSFDHLPSPRANAMQKRAYENAYATSNEWVRQRYFPSSRCLFEAPFHDNHLKPS